MTIFTWNYVLAVLAILGIYRIIGPRYRVHFLAGISMIWVLFQKSPIPFLGIVFATITLGLLLFGWLFGKLIPKQKTEVGQKSVLIVGIIVAIMPLFLFRYIFGEGAVLRIFLTATERMGAGAGAILAPLGISYFTFRIICYLVEVYKKTIEPIKPSEFLAYVLFFPTMLAGPIERVGTFIDQIRSDHQVDMEDITVGIKRIVTGLLKKLVLGAFFYQLTSPLFTLPTGEPGFSDELGKYQVWQLWFCFYMNFLYIYIDFSGYSDIAIGTSRLFGIKIIENFRYPILATNIAEFWQRFHISLTSWIRDYVYFPLGGSRGFFIKAAFNTILMMVLVGLWHGGAVHYAMFGIYMGSCLVFYRYWKKFKVKFLGKYTDREKHNHGAWPVLYKLADVGGWALTMTCYALGLVVFSFTTTKSVLIYGKMFGLSQQATWLYEKMVIWAL